MRLLVTMASIGLTACAVPVSDQARCEKDLPLADAARAALLEHADGLPDVVGEPMTRLILSVYAGCGR